MHAYMTLQNYMFFGGLCGRTIQDFLSSFVCAQNNDYGDRRFEVITAVLWDALPADLRHEHLCGLKKITEDSSVQISFL